MIVCCFFIYLKKIAHTNIPILDYTLCEYMLNIHIVYVRVCRKIHTGTQEVNLILDLLTYGELTSYHRH